MYESVLFYSGTIIVHFWLSNTKPTLQQCYQKLTLPANQHTLIQFGDMLHYTNLYIVGPTKYLHQKQYKNSQQVCLEMCDAQSINKMQNFSFAWATRPTPFPILTIIV